MIAKGIEMFDKIYSIMTVVLMCSSLWYDYKGEGGVATNLICWAILSSLFRIESEVKKGRKDEGQKTRSK